MWDGGPDQAVVPLEGGGNSLTSFVLHNERKLIEKRNGNEKRGERGVRGRQGETEHWKVEVRPCHHCPLPEQLQEVANPQPVGSFAIWKLQSLPHREGCYQEVVDLKALCPLGRGVKILLIIDKWPKTDSWRGSNAREGSWPFSPR